MFGSIINKSSRAIYGSPHHNWKRRLLVLRASECSSYHNRDHPYDNRHCSKIKTKSNNNNNNNVVRFNEVYKQDQQPKQTQQPSALLAPAFFGKQRQQRCFSVITSSSSSSTSTTATSTSTINFYDNDYHDELATRIQAIKVKCRTKTKHKECDRQLQKLYHDDIILLRIAKKEEEVGSKEKERSFDDKRIQYLILLLIQAYSEMNNAHRAEEILLSYADTYREAHEEKRQMEVNNNDNTTTYDDNNHLPPPPTIEMCLTVLTTWKKSKSSRRGSRAEKLLSLMEKDDALPNPNVACYTAVINCLASYTNKPKMAQRCELILRSMMLDEPNILTYTSVLNAYARSTGADDDDDDDDDASIQHCDRIFQEMMTSNNNNIIPDRRVYAVMISAWGRHQKRQRNNDSSLSIQHDHDGGSDAADAGNNDEGIRNAEMYFQQMIDNKIEPTVVEYTALIQAWSNYVSNNIEKSREGVERVEYLLNEMIDKSSSSSSSSSSNDDGACQPNSLTYIAVLKTISVARRIPNRRERAKKILKVMTKEGVQITKRIENIARKCNSRI